MPRYQVCLATIYSCGLRLQEGTHLQVADIDSARLMIHVRHGKGAKDRYVPLPKRTLELLRQYWRTHRHPRLLFPAEGRRDHRDLAKSCEPMSISSVQGAFRAALKRIRFGTVSATEFIRRFLQHVLPVPFVKVRYYGLLSPAHRQLLLQARQLLSGSTDKLNREELNTIATPTPLRCPSCGSPLILLSPITPRGRAP